MATYSFPADAFTVGGDPEAIRESGRAYGRFASVAGEAAGGLRGLDSGAWVGTEGDLFRGQLAEIPPHLDTACTAFAQVAGALDGFAEVLAGAQRQLAGVRADAEQTHRSLADARADRAALQQPTDEEVTADPSVGMAFDERRGLLDTQIGRLEAAWDDQLALVGRTRGQVLEAARRAGGSIRAAGRTSPTADQNWLEDRWEKGRRWASERLGDLKDFVAEHAGFFRGLAKALRVVGVALVAVGAVLTVLGFGGAVMMVGFAAIGAGDALGSTVDWAEGKITGKQLLFNAGLAVAVSFGAGRVAKPLVTRLVNRAPALASLAGRTRGWLDRVLSRPAGTPDLPSPPANPAAYSTAFETQLDRSVWGTSRRVHFNRANAALDEALTADQDFVAMMDELIPGVHDAVGRSGGRQTPNAWTWEHASSTTANGRLGVMRLVPSDQHTPGSPWWRVLHPDPGAAGGYAEWAIPNGAKPN